MRVTLRGYSQDLHCQDESEVNRGPVDTDGVPAVVVDTRMVTDQQRLSTAEVVTDLSEAAAQTDRQIVAVWSHLLFTDPEQQTVTGTRTDVQRDVQLATPRSTTAMILVPIESVCTYSCYWSIAINQSHRFRDTAA